MHDIALIIAAIGALGIGAQWLAWRMHLPAIVLLLIAGFVAGPVTGLINPVADFGEIYRPIVSIAVAIILFEGGLTLNFHEIRETSKAVRRMVSVAAPLVFGMTSLAAHYLAGLSWQLAFVIGGVLVVTGPTVVMPLLRQARLKSRPASVLRWEAIVNDPVGALFAVIAFEIVIVSSGALKANTLLIGAIVALVVGIGGGILAGRGLVWLYTRGLVPEYLKVPVLIASVLAAFAATNLLLEEAGLLTVTVMGITMANSRLASLNDLKRFKEGITVLLVSGLFIILTAALDLESLSTLDWRAMAFVFAVIFIIRPIAIFIATIGTGLTLQERTLIAWIAPRGIVAVAVTGLFAATLIELNIEGAERLPAITFAVVVATIILHGFSLIPVAKLLGLRSSARPGLLIVGGSRFSASFAKKLKELEIPVMVADASWSRLKEARLAEVPVYFGEVLSEDAHYGLDYNAYPNVLAATDNDAYNTLICTNFAPELGRSHVFQIAGEEKSERKSVAFTLGGRILTKIPHSLGELRQALFDGQQFQSTKLTETFGFDAYKDTRPENTDILLWMKPGGALVFPAASKDAKPQAGDVLISFGPPVKSQQVKAKDEIENTEKNPERLP